MKTDKLIKAELLCDNLIKNIDILLNLLKSDEEENTNYLS